MGSSFFAFVAIFSTLLRISITGLTNSDTLEIDCGRRQQQDIVSERIVNGTKAHPDHWPWMVGLYTANDTFYCGGVLISSQYVLTAAHCYKDKNTTGFLSVRLGSTNRTNFTVDCHRNADKSQNLELSDTAVRHEESEDKVICVEVDHVCIPVQGNNCTDFMVDLALLKLKRPVNFTKHIQPICLPTNCEEPPSDVTISGVGWGRDYASHPIQVNNYDYTYSGEATDETTDDTGEYSYYDESSTEEETNETPASEEESAQYFEDPVTLMERNISLISNDKCAHQLARSVPNYTLCSTGGICFGDSGGPLIYQKEGRWFLTAINSARRDSCYHPVEPTIHVRVSHFVDSFILKIIKHHQESQEGGTNGLCARDEDRKKCVQQFFRSYNRSINE
ncbi:chymotrypsinogen B-like [Ixodes scapularis]|uniref:chymotrypsinogen B-like n=1 Tax=Ixodes scapularis TaxID=6945 RepID=UPI001A9F28EE|nr:chymotrypsinogen B-like [Ixodes scapularis]